jgi:hypothetical protein
MKRFAIALAVVMGGAIFAPLASLGQGDNTLYVKQFPGQDVGAKLTNAMKACNPNPAVSCVLVLDPSLGSWAPGVMPNLCAQCSLVDNRAGASSAVATGITSYAGLLSALGFIPARGGTLVVSGPVAITSNYTLPSSVKVRVEAGGSFNVAAGQYLQIAGPLEAGPYQIFTGPGAVYFGGGVSASTEKVIPQWFGATGSAKSSGFASTAGNPVVAMPASGRAIFAVGDPVTLVGAGVSGATYTTTVTAVSGMNVTVAVAPSTTVANSPMYSADDTPALQAWANSVRSSEPQNPSIGYDLRASNGPSKLYVPKGTYIVGCSVPLRIYSSIILEFEAANTNEAARFYQCSPYVSAVRLSPFNLDLNGNVINISGNEIIKSFNIYGSYIIGNVYTPGVVFDPAPNLWGDTEIDHIYCGTMGGACLHAGFATTVTASAGASSITVGDGSVFVTGQSIIIAGAGTSGAALTTVIGGCGTAPCGNTFSISPSIVTTVSGATVTPAQDWVSLKINNPEMDVTQTHFIEFVNNATASAWINNAEFYQTFSSAVYINTPNPPILHMTQVECYGCGIRTASNNADNYAVFVNNSGAVGGDVKITGLHSYRLGSPLQAFGAGGVMVSTVAAASVTDSEFWDYDSGSAYKVVRIVLTPTVSVQGNIFTTTTASGGIAVSVCCTPGADATSLNVSNNTFKAGSYSGIAIGPDMNLSTQNSIILGNQFVGTFTTKYSANLGDVAGVRINGANVIPGTAGAPVGTSTGGVLLVNGSAAAGSYPDGAAGTWTPLPVTKSGTPTAGHGVCWKTSTQLGDCTAGTWPNCTTCN